jgi:hypothetical protein
VFRREGRSDVFPLYRDPHFTFHFAADRLVGRFHLEGVGAGQRVSVFRLARSGERGEWIGTATAGEGGWVDLLDPIVVRAGEGFVAVPEPDT